MDIKFEESLALIRKDRKNFALLPYDIKNNKDFIKQALKKSNGLLGIDIKYISDELKDDRDFIKEIISIKPYALAYASEKLQDDLELVFIAIEKDPFVIEVLDHIKDKYNGNFEQLALDKDKFLLNEQLEETIPEKIISSNKKVKTMNQFDDKEIKQILNNNYSNPAYTDIELINIEIFKTIINLFKQFPTLCSIKLKAKEFHSVFYLYTIIEHIIPGNNCDLTGQLKSLDEVHTTALQNIKQVNFHKDIQSRFFNQFEHDPFATDVEIFTFTVKNTRGENNINFIDVVSRFLGSELLTKINYHYLEKELTNKQEKKGNHERKI